MVYLISYDTNDSSTLTVTTAPQILKTITTDENSSELLKVTAQLRIATTGTSAVQTVPLTITLGGVTRTYNYTSKATVDKELVTIMYTGVSRIKDTITVGLGAAAGNDAQTSVICQYVEVMELNF